jgi:hypothetical protein
MQMNAAVPSWHRRLSKKPDGRPVTGVLERDRLGRRLVGEIRRDRAPVADEGDELRHRRSDAVAQVRLVNIHGRGQRGLAVREQLRVRRLVRDEDSDLPGMVGDKGGGVHHATGGGKEIHGSRAQRRDHPMQVVGVLVWGGFGGVVGLRLRSTPRGS